MSYQASQSHTTVDPARLARVVVPRPDSPYYLTLAERDDFGALEALNRAASRDEVAFPLTAATIGWLVESNPAGPGFVVLARAREGDGIVGHFVFYPKLLRLRPRPGAEPVTTPCYLYVSLYVVPTFRRVGVFAAMTRYGMELLAAAGLRFAYTVPNPRSGAGFLKFGMHRLGDVPFWASPQRAVGRLFGLVAAPGAALAGRRVAVEPATAFDERHEELTSAGPPSARVWGQRSLAELRWRFEARPGVRYRIWNLVEEGRLVGYAVTRRVHVGGREVLVVCDQWLRPGREAGLARLVNHLRAAEARGTDLLVSMAGHSGAAGASALLGAGLLPVPQRLLPQPVAVIGGPVGERPPDGGEVAEVPLRDWYATPYDWDVF